MRYPLIHASLLFGPLAVAATQWSIHLSPRPSQSLKSEALPETEARLILAHHLGLDEFHSLGDPIDLETWYNVNEQPFFAQGVKNSLLVAVESRTPLEFLPEELESPSYTMTETPAISSLISTYTSNANNIYSEVYTNVEGVTQPGYRDRRILDIFRHSPDSPAGTKFQEEIQSMLNFQDDSTGAKKFGAFQVTSLDMVAEEFGADSDEYHTAVWGVTEVLTQAVSAGHNVALISISTSLSGRAAPPQSPFPPPNPNIPIFSSNCHVSAAACTNATTECSGRGQCLEIKKGGRSCFTCQCQVTLDRTGVKTHWAGAACQNKDVSSTFVLLVGSTLFVLFLGYFSVSLLYSVGSQELPSTLTGGAVSYHRE